MPACVVSPRGVRGAPVDRVERFNTRLHKNKLCARSPTICHPRCFWLCSVYNYVVKHNAQRLLRLSLCMSCMAGPPYGVAQRRQTYSSWATRTTAAVSANNLLTKSARPSSGSVSVFALSHWSSASCIFQYCCITHRACPVHMLSVIHTVCVYTSKQALL